MRRINNSRINNSPTGTTSITEAIINMKTENDHINLKVAGQDGSVVQFKIKRHTPLSKLMKAYCERQGLSIRQIRFRFDGQPINETDTPAQLEMEDEDTIDVFQQQTGGGSFLSEASLKGVWTPRRLLPL
ncbi:small ubiquitin-related modifier 3-like [Salmo salar]|uniref:Small ubiquitin-related modifier 3-like n=1 Tax=Salmo salar TaxID=8030 RepID=A0ABM3EM99_SALSA|nr:small ubiquitin-related modifier 3-like [Salmo salar]